MDHANAIATVVLEAFDRLSANRKPAVRANGVREWVPLSGIVAEFRDGELVCLALATGMKCLPASKLLSAKGVGIHDSHAEVLALRAFNRFVLQECRDILLLGDSSPFLQRRQEKDSESDGPGVLYQGHPFEWRADVSLHMYCSEAPCGDASMELTMAAQDNASPWDTPAEAATGASDGAAPSSVPVLTGRGYFSRLGTVRRKPGRGDAPLTLSKSCSDKLALRQCTTLLSGLVSLLVAPSSSLCLYSVVLPVTQYSEAGCRRCFSAEPDIGRMAPVAGHIWPGGYAFAPFTVQKTSIEFACSKRSVADAARLSASSSASSNLSIAWTYNGVNECLVGGVLRGRKAFDPAGASAVSRRRMWKLAREVADEVLHQYSDGERRNNYGASQRQHIQQIQSLFQADMYDGVKAGELFAARERVKEDVKSLALRGWIKNEGDGDWGLDTV